MTGSLGRIVLVPRRWLVGIVAVVIALALVSASYGATARPTYVSSAIFGHGDLGGSMAGIAVEPGSGNILAVDSTDAVVRVYAPDQAAGGTLLTTVNVGGGPINIAVDPVDKSFYVLNPYGASAIQRFTTDGAATPTYTLDGTFSLAPGALTAYDGGIAVDPTTRDLLVVDTGAHRVVRISHQLGTVLGSFDGSDAPGGAFAAPTAIAVGANGTTYVVDGGASVERFTAAGAYSGTLPLPSGVPVQSVAVNQTTGDVVVGTGLPGFSGTVGTLYGFTAAGAPLFQSDYPAESLNQVGYGVAWDAGSDRIYASMFSYSDFQVEAVAFNAAVLPGVDTPTVSSIGMTGAHVSAGVDAGAAPPGDTHARFEYCNAKSACDSFPKSNPGDPSNPWQRLADRTVTGSSVSDDLALAPNTTYKVRLVAFNSAAASTSSPATFTTVQSPPEVVTGTASPLSATAEELQGTINPFGLPTTYHFEYGLGTDYGSSVPVPEATAFNGTVARTFTRQVAGLQSGTLYHFRLVATNAAGTTLGADQTFATNGSAVRGYEQVSPVNKRGATLNEVFGFQTEANGNGLEYALQSAPEDVSSAPQFPRYMSTRGTDNWTAGTPLDPPTATTVMFMSSTTLAVSGDFQHTFVASNRALAPGGIDGQGNLYAVDITTGAYRFVGTSSTPAAFGTMVGLNQANMFLAGAADFSWIVFVSRTPLLSGVSGAALYKWTADGGLKLLSALPDGTLPSEDLIIQSQTIPATRWVSDDGTQGYFALAGGSDDGVYRWKDGQSTRAISVSHASGGPTGTQPGQLAFVSRDGRYAVFLADQLTDNAPAGVQSAYVFDASDNSLQYIGTTNAGAIEDALAASDDGRTVYLDTPAGVEVWRNGASHIFRSGLIHPLTAFVSPSGRYLAFSDGPDPVNRPDVLDVYVYDADTQHLTCVTCANGLAEGQQQARLPLAIRNISNRVPVAVTDSGSVYFDTDASLVAGDRNGMRDVYEFNDGSLALISPGTGKYDARYSDATDNGDNVFFTTAQPLVGQDNDTAPDIYDARVGGGIPAQSPPSPPAVCVGSECREASSGITVSPFVISLPSSGTTASSRSNLTKVRISLAKVSFTAKALHISIKTSQRGRAKVTGSRVKTTVRDLSAAGTYRMVVPLSNKARSLRRAHRRFKVTAKVTVAGGWGSAAAKISRTLGK